MNDIARRLQKLRQSIEASAEKSGRDPAAIELLAVSKTFPPVRVEEAYQSGQLNFGENRVQEARHKIPALADRPLRWHLIGHLQSNKANLAVQLFDVIQTLDSPRLVERVASAANRLNKTIAVYMQVNLGAETQKYGVPPAETQALLELINDHPRLRPQGLMAIPPFSVDPEGSRRFFRQLFRLREDLNRGRSQPLTGLSMGMSHDFEVAIEEGATLVRVGTAIFGSRKA